MSYQHHGEETLADIKRNIGNAVGIDLQDGKGRVYVEKYLQRIWLSPKVRRRRQRKRKRSDQNQRFIPDANLGGVHTAIREHAQMRLEDMCSRRAFR